MTLPTATSQPYKKSDCSPIAHLVELDVFGDVLSKLDRVPGLPTDCHHQIVGQLKCLVIIWEEKRKSFAEVKTR